MALTDHANPEEIKRATMHATNKEFERYSKVKKPEVKSIYEMTRCTTNDQPKKKRVRK